MYAMSVPGKAGGQGVEQGAGKGNTFAGKGSTLTVYPGITKGKGKGFKGGAGQGAFPTPRSPSCQAATTAYEAMVGPNPNLAGGGFSHHASGGWVCGLAKGRGVRF